jgi:antitoxin ParD1/3/4
MGAEARPGSQVEPGSEGQEGKRAQSLARSRSLSYNARITTRPITLRDEHELLIQQAVKSGRYLSESEVIAAALSEFQVHEEIRRARFAELKAKIQVGIGQLDCGETAEFDLKAFLAARNAEHPSHRLG